MWQTIFKPLNVSGCYDELFYYLWLAGVTQVGKHFACNARGCICLPWFCSKMSNSMLNWESVFLTQFCVSVRVFHKAEFIRHLHAQTWALLVLKLSCQWWSLTLPTLFENIWEHSNIWDNIALLLFFWRPASFMRLTVPPFCQQCPMVVPSTLKMLCLKPSR